MKIRHNETSQRFNEFMGYKEISVFQLIDRQKHYVTKNF